MSTEVAKAAVNEALELSYLFRQNAALKHGLPHCDKQKVDSVGESAPSINAVTEVPAAPAATDSPSPGSTAAAAVKSSLLRRAAPWLLGGAATIASGALGAWLASGDSTTVIEQANDGLLLPWLEENGKHLPEDQQWQK